MAALNLNSYEPGPKGSKKNLSILIGVAVICGAFALSSTFAGNIGLNSGKPVEFGQGVTSTTACDNEITITPYSSFVNEPGGGRHLLTSIKISGIDSTSSKCSGKTFAIRAYGDSGLLNIFNYSHYDQDTEFNKIEILDSAGEFSWVSGGTDGDDLLNDDNLGDPSRDLTNTSFTVNFTSNAYPIVRTALASAQEVKSITVETYSPGLLNSRILTTSQIGYYLQELTPESGFYSNQTFPDPTCSEPSCGGYVTFHDWFMNMTDVDVENWSTEIIGTSGLTRSQISDAVTFKFLYDAQADSNSPWTVLVQINGQVSGPPFQGSVLGFDRHTGVFFPTIGPQIPFFFSLDGRLQGNSSIGSFVPYADQPNRRLPVRNIISIWVHSEDHYFEGN